ncbi:MAG: thiamine-binding protein, partial [Cyclobacteriaceae bacterium]
MTDHLITLGIQIVPKSSSHDTYALVDRAIDIIQQSGVKYEITPFETVMEGKYEDLMMISEIA